MILFTDGACRGNPGKGSWAVLGIIDLPGGEQTKIDLCGYKEETTNNEMELSALYAALGVIPNSLADEENIVYSDSQITVRGFNEWLEGWVKNNFYKGTNREIAHIDLWNRIYALKQRLNVKCVWVKAHADNDFNNYVDKLCNQVLDDPSIVERKANEAKARREMSKV